MNVLNFKFKFTRQQKRSTQTSAAFATSWQHQMKKYHINGSTNGVECRMQKNATLVFFRWHLTKKMKFNCAVYNLKN